MDRFVRPRTCRSFTKKPYNLPPLIPIEELVSEKRKFPSRYVALPDISSKSDSLSVHESQGRFAKAELAVADITENKYRILPGIGRSQRIDNKNTDASNRRLNKPEIFIENEIEKDWKKIESMVKAENGEWGVVWNILGTPQRPKRDYLINVIPSGSEMGLLHHAVIQGNCDSLERLVAFKACDRKALTKRCLLNTGEVGRWDLNTLIKNYANDLCLDILSKSPSFGKEDKLDTFCDLEFDSNSFPLLKLGLSIHKSTFHPKRVNRKTPICDLLKTIFNDIDESEERWMSVKELVYLSIKDTCDASNDTIEAIKDSQTHEEFYKAVIRAYTGESNGRLYTQVNNALRRQRNKNYRPTSLDLELCPFILMHEMVLLYWNKLRRESNLTYRRVLLTDADLAKYQVDIRFVWTSFISSSANEELSKSFPTCDTTGQNVVAFTFDNNKDCAWQPRDVAQYATYAEYERTYPAGAQFEVVKRETRSDCTHVKLKLISS